MKLLRYLKLKSVFAKGGRKAGGRPPDAGRTPSQAQHDTGADALALALSGSDGGSDTRAGSLRGGSASGSDNDPDQDAIDEMLATEGMAAADDRGPPKPPEGDRSGTVRNTGEDEAAAPEPGEAPHGKRGEADAATG